MSRPVSLIQLIANGVMNDSFPNNYSMNLHLINAISNIPYQIEKYCDAIIFDGLIIPKINNQCFNINDIINIEIIIDETIIYNIPFDLLHNYIKTTNDDYLITIPNELVNFNSNNEILKNKLIIPLITLKNQNVLFKLNCINIEKFNYQIITKNIYYQANLRTLLETSSHEIDIYQYQEFPLTNNINIINPKLLSTGIFIKVNSKLIDYELYLDNFLSNKISKGLFEYYSLLKYKNEPSIDSYVYIDKPTKNEYLYFIPFNMIDNNIDGTINFSHINNVRINILTEDNIYDGKIYIKNVNKIKL